jgi:hypothetical protein
MGISRVQKEILTNFFENWAYPLMEKYHERPGELPPEKYYLALAQALHGPLSLPEILQASKTGVSYDLLRYLRSKNQTFQQVSKQAAMTFAHYFASLVLQSIKDVVRRLVLSEILITLPGFDLVENPAFEALQHAAIECGKNPKNVLFKKLHDLLLTFRDIVRLAHDTTPPEKWPAKEENLAEAISPLLDSIDSLVAQSNLEPELKETIGNLTLSLQFLMSYSKVVI